MIRMLTMVGLALGSASFVLPMLTVAQGNLGQANPPTEASRKFRAYLDDDWKRWLQESPELATAVGFPGQNQRWTDESPQGIEARKTHLHESIAKLKTFQRDALSVDDQLNYDLYRSLLETTEEGLQYGDDPVPFGSVVPTNLWMPQTQMDGIQDAANTLASMPARTVADYEDIVARLEALPKAVDQTLTLLQEGLKRGYTPPKITLRDVPKQFADLVPADPLASPLLQPFTQFPAGLPEADRARLTERAKKVYVSMVAPAYTRYREYIVSTYLPACRDSIAATTLPNGPAAYAFHVRWQTTTDLSPKEIHEIGLAEVKRIRAEMDRVIASSGFKGTFREFTEFLRTDPRFYYDRPEDLVNGYRVIAKKIDPQLSVLFGKLPRLTYGVLPIPDFKAPSQTTAYYQPGSVAVGRPGYYFANTYKLHERPKWEMEALTLHEAVPGHHLQFSLGQELVNEPEFRKNAGYSAYVEGWALYAESLGEDLGLYKDPYSKFGQLTYEMWRAVRLVVDTGMHTMGWTRQQAIDYFHDNTGKSGQDITAEIDRYIVWPGQALAYKIGQMKIRELRGEAEKKLGARFDVRRFHDAVLANGALPLKVLEVQMRKWMSEEMSDRRQLK
ncbi:MAG: DUF885 domain-containing protein [Candidatus Acidiferrum sp.]